MRLRIGIVFALGLLAWLFVVRPAARRVALADVYNRVNENRCCTDGLRRSPNACGRALEELARTARRTSWRSARTPRARIAAPLWLSRARRGSRWRGVGAPAGQSSCRGRGGARMQPAWWAEDEVCCPQQCIDAYSEARAAGKNEMTALMDGYGVDGTCGQTR